METKFAFALLVLCLHSVCGDVATKSEAMFSNQGRKLQAVSVESAFGFGEAYTSNDEICTPVIRVDVGYKRSGTVAYTFNNLLLAQCLATCETSGSVCIAFNYNPSSKTCELLSTPGAPQENADWTSSLIRFAGGSVCNTANIVFDITRPAHDYHIFPSGAVKTSEACCEKCLDESPTCVAWDYNIDSETCYLKNAIPAFTPASTPGIVSSGIGAYCAEPNFGAST